MDRILDDFFFFFWVNWCHLRTYLRNYGRSTCLVVVKEVLSCDFPNMCYVKSCGDFPFGNQD